VSENRFNLIILPERKSDVDLCFIGHVDTVTAFDLEDYGFYEDGDIVSGLGIADMKAGCAAMIEAFTVLASSEQMPSTVGLVLVVGEEEESDGAFTVIREYSFPWAIVAEPTNLMPCLGHYGYLEVMLRTRGKRAHSSMPEYGQNAIESMLKLLLKMSEYAGSAANGLVYNVRELSASPGIVVPYACDRA
jgi:acetylornithine deacetylase